MNIKILVMDIDGTLTDGRIYIGAQGEVMKAFDVKDGYAITWRSSAIVEERAKELRITELYQGVSDKLSQLKIVAKKYAVSPEEIAYIGDDLNDLECIIYCGVTGCPNDAVQEVKSRANYVCKQEGGRGAVREFIDWILYTSRC